MEHRRVLLSSIKALTLYAGEKTLSRRGRPVPQLTCIGDACKYWTPDAVQCINVGGDGVDVNWKCDADLLDTLRFGRVTVSCEGWSGPGDTHVLQGSCGLEYRLVQIPGTFRPSTPGTSQFSNFAKSWIDVNNIFGTVFNILWAAVFLFFAWSIIKSCFAPGNTARQAPPRFTGNTGGGGGGPRPTRRWPWGNDGGDTNGPPPPYSQNDSSSYNAGGRWQPGFWTGLGMGGIAASLYGLNRRNEGLGGRRAWDWELDRERAREAERERERERLRAVNARFGGREDRDWDRGEGSSSGPATRRSTGVGGSNVR